MSRLNLRYIIIQNLKRKPYRTIALAVFVMMATGTLFAATLTLRAVQTSLQVGLERLGADVIIVPRGQQITAQEAFIVGQPTTFYMDQRVEQEIAALPGVGRVSAQVFAQTLTNASCCFGEFFLVGFDPRNDFTISPWLATHLAGRAIAPDEIVVGDRILLRPGETVYFYGSYFKVAGVLAPTGMGIDRTVFVPIEGMRQMIAASPTRAEKPLTIAPDQVSVVLVKAQPGANPNELAEQIERKNANVHALTASHMILAVSKQFANSLGVIVAVIAIWWLMALVAIALVF
ncbi:MAG: ABC transporter permease, partial [Chloroflexota bacterium]